MLILCEEAPPGEKMSSPSEDPASGSFWRIALTRRTCCGANDPITSQIYGGGTEDLVPIWVWITPET